MTIEGPRLLSKDIGAIFGSTNELGISTITEPSPYSLVQLTATLQAAVYRGYFDLTGTAMEDLTLFVQGAEVQEGTVPSGDTNLLTIHDIMSTEPIDDAEIISVLTTGPPSTFFGNQFGYSTSTLDLDQILYGNFRIYQENSTISPSIPYLVGSTKFGVGVATARDKLFITRIVINHQIPPALGVVSWSAPPVNFVVGAMIAKESHSSHLMRLKQSYEHANTVV